MIDSLEQFLESLESSIPPVVLIGGNNDYLVARAFHLVRDRVVSIEPSTQIEDFSETADLGVVLDSYRTHALFVATRLLLVPEVNAFVTAKELAALLKKAFGDWKSAKTERKRSSATAKLLHTIALVGLDLESSDDEIAEALGVAGKEEALLGDMLTGAREGGKKVGRGEGDAALLVDAISAGGAPGATLLMKAGALPVGSATIEAIGRAGKVIVCDLSRESFGDALDTAIAEIEEHYEVKFQSAAVSALRDHLGVTRVLSDKRSKEIPDLRLAVSEAIRFAGFAGKGQKVTAAIVEKHAIDVVGGKRFEFASLVSDGKVVEAVEKLRDLVAQARREDPRTPTDVVYGRYVLSLADEFRQILGAHSFCRAQGLDPRQRVQYNQFKDTVAPQFADYLEHHGLTRQKLHPYAAMKKFEAARRYSEKRLVRALDLLARMEYDRKSGGPPVDICLETAVLGLGAR